MRRSKWFFGVLVVLACAGLAIVPASVEAGGEVDAQALGGGHYANPGFPPLGLGPTMTQFGFNAQIRKGVPEGEGTTTTKAWGVSLHFDVVHMSVHNVSNGPAALNVGIITKGSWGVLAPALGTSDATGWVFVNAVQDRGNGAKQDYVSDAVFLPPGFPVALAAAIFGAGRIANVNDNANTRVVTGNVKVNG